MTSSEMAVRSRVRDFLSEAVGQDTLDDETDIFETGVVTSLFAMELVLYVESAFGITVENDDIDLENFSSIQNVANFVESKLG